MGTPIFVMAFNTILQYSSAGKSLISDSESRLKTDGRSCTCLRHSLLAFWLSHISWSCENRLNNWARFVGRRDHAFWGSTNSIKLKTGSLKSNLSLSWLIATIYHCLHLCLRLSSLLWCSWFLPCCGRGLPCWFDWEPVLLKNCFTCEFGQNNNPVWQITLWLKRITSRSRGRFQSIPSNSHVRERMSTPCQKQFVYRGGCFDSYTEKIQNIKIKLNRYTIFHTTNRGKSQSRANSALPSWDPVGVDLLHWSMLLSCNSEQTFLSWNGVLASGRVKEESVTEIGC